VFLNYGKDGSGCFGLLDRSMDNVFFKQFTLFKKNIHSVDKQAFTRKTFRRMKFVWLAGVRRKKNAGITNQSLKNG